MADIAIVGNDEFVMGFELIGIRQIFVGETKEELQKSFQKALESSAGIIVTNDKSIGKLDANQRRNIENSVSPIVVVLSKDNVAQDNLRDMIKKAIGIDLLNR